MAEPEHGPPIKEKTRTFNAIKNASTTYRSTWRSGGAKGFAGGTNQVHHIVPCTSLKHSLGEFLEGKPPEFRDALDFYTVWDVNEKYNLFGMPTQETYNIAFRVAKRLDLNRPAWETKRGGALYVWASKMTPKYPVHLWGHPHYNDKVKKDLDPVWTKLSDSEEEHKPVEGVNLKSELQAVSDRFKGKITGKTGQTREDWDKGDGHLQQFHICSCCK